MLKGCSRFVVMLGMATLAGASVAQVPESNTIGNPQLRDFELRGNTTQPAPTPVETAPPPVTITPPPPPVIQTPPADPAPRPPERQVAAPSEPTPAPARPQEAPTAAAPQNKPAATVPEPVVIDDALPAPVAPAPLPQAAPTTIREAEGDGLPWLYIGLALLAALAAFAAARVFLRRRAEQDEIDEAPPEEILPQPAPLAAAPGPRPQPARAADPAPQPTPSRTAEPAPALVSSGIVGIQVRPWIELEFKPDRAVATDADTSVQFDLIVRNTGNTGARNVRIEGRMFNAGREEEREIGAFFSEPLMINCASIPMLLPQGTGSIRSAVSMPRTEVKEITLEGRRLFVPMVAFNVTYEWGENRVGQTSMSYLVGRETDPSEKMGAFRLDLGPRLYRSVGQRQTNLALVV